MNVDYRADEVIEAFEETRQPKLQSISWAAVFAIGMLVAFVPAVAWGCIVTWLAWSVANHTAALVVGFTAFLLSLWSGGWVALIIQIVPMDWIKEIR